mgnify:CR=1 FL=1
MTTTVPPGHELVRKGFLLTLPDGHEAVLRNDETFALNAAVQGRGRAEALFVVRPVAYSDDYLKGPPPGE